MSTSSNNLPASVVRIEWDEQSMNIFAQCPLGTMVTSLTLNERRLYGLDQLSNLLHGSMINDVGEVGRHTRFP